MKRKNLSPRRQFVVALTLVAVAPLSVASSPVGAPSVGGPLQGQGGLTIDQLLAIRHPSSPLWSPVGERVAFLWEGDGSIDLWWTEEGLEEPVPVTDTNGGARHAVSGFDWTTDGVALVSV